MNLPNFFILGAAKSGTTALSSILGRHKNIYIPKEKELAFLVKPEVESNLSLLGLTPLTNKEPAGGNFHLGWKWYKKFFETSTVHKWVGEASAMYFQNDSSIVLLKKYFPEAKFIIILRDPVDRIYSHFNFEIKKAVYTRNPNFAHMIQNRATRLQYYYKTSHYKQRINKYLAQFPKNQFLFLLFDDLKTDKPKVLREVCNFLDIPFDDKLLKFDTEYNQHAIPKNIFIEKMILVVANNIFFKKLPKELINSLIQFKKIFFSTLHLYPTAVPYEKLDPTIRKRIIPDFIDDIKYVEKLLNRDLSHWKI